MRTMQNRCSFTFMFECLNVGGELSVYAKQSHTQYQLLVRVIDHQPLQIKYVSFTTWGSNPVEFLYDCSAPLPPFDGFATFSLAGSEIHPLLLNEPALPSNVAKSNCKYFENK